MYLVRANGYRPASLPIDRQTLYTHTREACTIHTLRAWRKRACALTHTHLQTSRLNRVISTRRITLRRTETGSGSIYESE